MKESAKYLCHAMVSRLASHRMCYVKIVLPLGTQQKQWLHKDIYFAFTTKPAKQGDNIWARWRAQSPCCSSSFSFHKKSCYVRRKTTCTKARHENLPKPAGGKKLGTLPPDQGRGANLGVLGYTM